MPRRRRDIDFSPSKTLCWTCEHAVGGCSWADDQKPVQGWDAEETYVESAGFHSYLVHGCPEYLDSKSVNRDPQSMDTQACVRLLQRAMEIARRDYITGNEDTRFEVEQFILDWVPGGTALIAELEKQSERRNKKAAGLVKQMVAKEAQKDA